MQRGPLFVCTAVFCFILVLDVFFLQGLQVMLLDVPLHAALNEYTFVGVCLKL